MSDMGFYEDDGGSYPTEDELIMMMLGQNGNTLPGKTPANRLNFMQDLEQSLGVPITQLMGIDSPAQEAPPVSLNRQVYGSNPLYATIFDAIDQGADPTSALAAAQPLAAEQGVDWNDTAWRDEVQKVATDYAMENAKNAATVQKASYTRPDGSKYKNTPLGGNDIMGMMSEYDLLGMPDEDKLIAEYARTVKPKDAGSASKNMQGRAIAGTTSSLGTDGNGGLATLPSRAAKGAAEGVGRAWNAGVDELSDQVIDHLPGWAGGGKGMVGGMLTDDSDLRGDKSQLEKGWSVGGKAGSSNKGRGSEPIGKVGKPLDPNAPTGGGQFSDNPEVEKYAQQAAHAAVGNRIKQSKSTMVRSDANMNLMRRILALRSFIG